MLLQQSRVVFLFAFYLFVFWYSYFVCRHNISIIIIRNGISVFHGYDINNVVTGKRQEHWQMLNINHKYQILYEINIQEG